MEVPMYYLPDDGTGNDGTVLCQDSEKKKIRIQFSHLLFLNGIFYNILYPMMLFFYSDTVIRKESACIMAGYKLYPCAGRRGVLSLTSVNS